MKTPKLNEIKAVAVDMDGTLLNDNKELTSATKNCIEKLKINGILPILVTGRSFEALEPFKKKLALTTPVICYNGAQIIDGTTGKLLQDYLLPEESSRLIIGLARKENVHFQAYKDGVLYFEKYSPEAEYYENHVNLKGEIVNFDEMEPLEFTKMMYVGDPAHLKKMKKLLQKTISHNTAIMFSKAEFLEFMHKDVSKGNALLTVLADLGITPEETIAFGDGDNDVSMLRAAGIGVAMENAAAIVKDAADFTAPSNNNDGIVRFLESMCF